MPEVLTLEDIAEENDVVLLDSNAVGCTGTEVGGKRRDVNFLTSPVNQIKTIVDILLDRYSIISENKNILTINEVIKECDFLVDTYGTFSNIAVQSKTENSRKRAVYLTGCNSLLNKSLALLRKRELHQKQSSIYHPLIAITLEAASLMPNFSNNKKHYSDANSQVITDELLVSNAFALSASSNAPVRIGIVSYDSRIEPLIAGTYSLLLAKQLFPQNAELGDRILENKISSYGIRKGIVRKAGEFFEQDVLRLVRDDLGVKRDEKLYSVIKNFIEEVERFNRFNRFNRLNPKVA